TSVRGCRTSAKPRQVPSITATIADQNDATRLTCTARRSETLFQASANQASVQPVKLDVCLPSDPMLNEYTTDVTIGANRNSTTSTYHTTSATLPPRRTTPAGALMHKSPRSRGGSVALV